MRPLRVLRGDRGGARLVHERFEVGAKTLSDERARKCARLVEGLVGASDREVAWDDSSAGDSEDAAQILLRPDRTKLPRGCSCDGNGLVAEPASAMSGRRPVDRVLQDSRERSVVLRRDQQKRVGLCDSASERGDGLGFLDALLVEILVVVGDEAEALVDLDLDPVRRELPALRARAPCCTSRLSGFRRSPGFAPTPPAPPRRSPSARHRSATGTLRWEAVRSSSARVGPVDGRLSSSPMRSLP